MQLQDTCLTLRAFGATVTDITQTDVDKITKKTLLKARPSLCFIVME